MSKRRLDEITTVTNDDMVGKCPDQPLLIVEADCESIDLPRNEPSLDPKELWGPPIEEEPDTLDVDLTALIKEHGLDFSKMAKGRDVGHLLRRYYSRPLAAFEEETTSQGWQLERREVRVAYRGRAWKFAPNSQKELTARAVLVPCISAPDVPGETFPVFVVDFFRDEQNDGILKFKWFYTRGDLNSKVQKRTFLDNELVLGTHSFTTPLDYIHDATLVGPASDKRASFVCRRVYNETTFSLRSL